MAKKVIVLQKKIMSRSFLKSGTLPVIVNMYVPEKWRQKNPFVLLPRGKSSKLLTVQEQNVRCYTIESIIHM